MQKNTQIMRLILSHHGTDSLDFSTRHLQGAQLSLEAIYSQFQIPNFADTPKLTLLLIEVGPYCHHFSLCLQFLLVECARSRVKLYDTLWLGDETRDVLKQSISM